MNRKSPAPLKAGERRRYFLDPDGHQWEVYEAKMPGYDRRDSHCLIFESINVIRRVRNYPKDWYERPDADLRALSNST